jgi:NADH-quinone oxidoreductase subunit H
VNLLFGGASNPVMFVVKMSAVLVLGLIVNASFPRLRIEQAIRYLWRWPTLIALVGLVLAVVVEG